MGQFIDCDGAEKLGKQLINEAFDVAGTGWYSAIKHP